MRVLVSYGTKRGGTEALARAVAHGLLEAGHAVDVMPSTQVDALDRWDAVVVGGTPYAWFWHRNSQRFIKRNVEDLFQAQPPLIIRLIETPPPQLAVQAPAGKPVWPEPEPETRVPSPTPRVLRRPKVKDATLGVHRLVLWLCLFTGVTSMVGGVSLLLDPGRELFLLPGLILFGVVGLGNLVAAALEARRVARSELVVSVAGAALTGWIVMQLVMRGSLSWLQLIYFAVGVSTVAASIWLWRARHGLAPLVRAG
jgi:hypothetical protein